MKCSDAACNYELVIAILRMRRGIPSKLQPVAVAMCLILWVLTPQIAAAQTLADIEKSAVQRDAAVGQVVCSFKFTRTYFDAINGNRDFTTDCKIAIKNGKYYDEYMTLVPPGPQANEQPKVGPNSVALFDGEFNHNFDANADSAPGHHRYDMRMRGKRQKHTTPLDFGAQIEGESISAMLKKGQCTMLGRQDFGSFGPTQFCSVVMPGGERYEIGFAANYDCLAVSYRKLLDMGNQDTQITEWHCEKAARFGNIWLPVVGRLQRFKQHAGDTKTLVDNVQVQNATYDFSSLSDALFEAAMEPGSVVYDGDRRLRYHTSGDGHLVLEPGQDIAAGAQSNLLAKLSVALAFIACMLGGLSVVRNQYYRRLRR